MLAMFLCVKAHSHGIDRISTAKQFEVAEKGLRHLVIVVVVLIIKSVLSLSRPVLSHNISLAGHLELSTGEHGNCGHRQRIPNRSQQHLTAAAAQTPTSSHPHSALLRPRSLIALKWGKGKYPILLSYRDPSTIALASCG